MCQDDPDWREKKGGDCNWVAGNPEKNCKKKDRSKVKAWTACQATCANYCADNPEKCTPCGTRAPIPAPTRAPTPPPTTAPIPAPTGAPIAPTDAPVTPTDAPIADDPDMCQDDPDWREKKGGDCNWVAGNPEKNCKKKAKSGVKAWTACQETCTNYCADNPKKCTPCGQ